MLAQLKKNVQPLFTGKFSVKFAIGFVRLGETLEFRHRSLHAENIPSLTPPNNLSPGGAVS